MPNFTTRNHYVPQWYQKMFMEVQDGTLHYLDLKPDKIFHNDGNFHYRKALRYLGTKKCFKDDHLYTLYLGENASDIIEKQFFGPIDLHGSRLVELFSYFRPCNDTKNGLQNFLRYIDAQKLRTPKGLTYLKKLANLDNHQDTLNAMGKIWQANCTMWMEGVWEIISCDNSQTKFILSDHPVTTYNKRIFPGSKGCKNPRDADISLLGTHTIFPLCLNRCLVITNLGYVRNPNSNPIKKRENARYFQESMFDIRKVQADRQVTEEYVLAINYIIKNRSYRYIASSNEDWLYPELKLKNTNWNKLGGKHFLMPDPRKVRFSTGVVMGFKNRPSWSQDEYGRQINDSDPKIIKLRNKEFDAHQKAQQSWDDMYGPLDKDDYLRYF